YAAKHGIEKKLLSCKASEISWPIMQKISLWCTSLLASRAVFIEEPDEGFYEECRPFDFLQGMLTSGITNCIIFSAAEKDSILQKARAMQLCRTRIAIFCADRLVEEGEATRVLENPTHNYTKVWIENGDLRPKINETVWKYCLPNCKKRYCKRQIFSSIMWDCEPNTLHKIMCRGFLE
ncbi:MAG: hypothetical protein LBC85_07895, partial [Fibromonadaceae bacterium]|nr:hypothetical protein [Fibromonadaceae bacterium]